MSRIRGILSALVILTLALAVGACEGKPADKGEKKDEKKTEKTAEPAADPAAQAPAADPAAEAPAADPAAEAPAGEEPAAEAPAAGGLVDLPQVGLKAELPAGSEVSDGIGGGVMVMGAGAIFSVAVADDMTPKDLEAAKSEADMYTPTNIQTETLADGFVMTFENTGGMGTNYWVNVRRDIDGKGYWCTTNVSSPEQQAAAVAACKSLTK